VLDLVTRLDHGCILAGNVDGTAPSTP
jgi:hypothetical protein